MSFLPYVIMGAQGILGAGGSLMQGYQQAAASKYNAKVLEQQAVVEQEAAGAKERQFRAQVDDLMATQKTAVAKSGIQNTGSALEVAMDTAAQSELDALMIRYGGQVAAAKLRAQAENERSQANNYITSGWLGAGASLLGAGASAYKWNTAYGKRRKDMDQV